MRKAATCRLLDSWRKVHSKMLFDCEHVGSGAYVENGCVGFDVRVDGLSVLPHAPVGNVGQNDLCAGVGGNGDLQSKRAGFGAGPLAGDFSVDGIVFSARVRDAVVE